jgi:hypothetical protein
LVRALRALEGSWEKGGRRGGVINSLGRLAKKRLWCKGSRKGGRARCTARQLALNPSLFLVSVLINLITINQVDPYDSELSSQSTTPEPLTFNDPYHEEFKHGQ